MDPPCGGCPSADPEPLHPANELVWHLWTLCHAHGRDGMTGRLMLGPLLDLARSCGAAMGEVERVLALETYLWPRLQSAAGKDER
ncbi:hypothetical protein [Deferrisoma camini]|uniref:hypothetical protein n=1 Tax=Deferrisoma camini TaxID=1035120 RepID=UPI00046D903D|nr:hypothetical protein [Deferrisoma camini]